MNPTLLPVDVRALLKDPSHIDTISRVEIHRPSRPSRVPLVGVDPASESLLGWSTVTSRAGLTELRVSPPVGYLEFHNVALFGQGSIASGEQCRSADGVVGPSKEAVRVARRDLKVYDHWLLVMLPSLSSLAEGFLSGDLPLLSSNLTPPFAKGPLTSAGINNELTTFRHHRQVVEVERLISPVLLNNHRAFHPEARQFFTSWAEQHTGPSLLGPLIHVARRPSNSYTYKRTTPKQKTLSESAMDVGFDVLCGEDWTIEEQIEIFSNAKFVTREAGPDCHNTVFSPSETPVLKLRSAGFPSCMQGTIAQLLDHDYLPLGVDDDFAPQHMRDAVMSSRRSVLVTAAKS